MALKDHILSWKDAVTEFENKSYPSAKEKFENINEPNAKILYNLACCCFCLKDNKGAARFLREALLKDEHLAIAHFQLGVAHYRRNRFNKALEDFQAAYSKTRSRSFIDYTQLGLEVRLYTCQVIYNIALCLVELDYRKMALEWLDGIPPEVPDFFVQNLTDAKESAKKRRNYKLTQLPITSIFQPSKLMVQNTEKVDYLGKAKVVAAADKNDLSVGFITSKSPQAKSPIVTPGKGWPLYDYEAQTVSATDTTASSASENEPSKRQQLKEKLLSPKLPRKKPPPDVQNAIVSGVRAAFKGIASQEQDSIPDVKKEIVYKKVLPKPPGQNISTTSDVDGKSYANKNVDQQNNKDIQNVNDADKNVKVYKKVAPKPAVENLDTKEKQMKIKHERISDEIEKVYRTSPTPHKRHIKAPVNNDKDSSSDEADKFNSGSKSEGSSPLLGRKFGVAKAVGVFDNKQKDVGGKMVCVDTELIRNSPILQRKFMAMNVESDTRLNDNMKNYSNTDNKAMEDINRENSSSMQDIKMRKIAGRRKKFDNVDINTEDDDGSKFDKSKELINTALREMKIKHEIHKELRRSPVGETERPKTPNKGVSRDNSMSDIEKTCPKPTRPKTPNKDFLRDESVADIAKPYSKPKRPPPPLK